MTRRINHDYFSARNYVQQFGLDEASNFQELIEYSLKWRNIDEYLVLQKQTKSLRIEGEIERETIAKVF